MGSQSAFYRRGKRVISLSLIPICLLFMECKSRRISRELFEVDAAKDINPKNEYLKVHLKNGDLYVLNSWRFDEYDSLLTGNGSYLDYNRKLIEDRTKAEDRPPFRIRKSEILLLETNDKGTNPGIAVLVVTSLLTGAFALACLINPKGCFGSCPTFYVDSDNEEKLVGEGFSSSISKSLEATDVDLIQYPLKEKEPFRLTVKNEAWETHMLNSINILAYPKGLNNRIIQETGGKFYEVGDFHPPTYAEYMSNSILDKVKIKDDEEWFSLANEYNLNSKEDIFLEFENNGQPNGILIEKRQSLMTTYLFYNLLAMLGKANSFYMAEMETKSPYLKKRVYKMYDLLGGIEVFIQNKDNRWVPVSTVREAGPIVTDTHLVKLPNVDTPTIKLRLRMTQGLWRINTLNLVSLHQEVVPLRYKPNVVRQHNQVNQTALQKLHSEEYLVTFPGDEYVLEYPLYVDPEVEYFIESKGYYIEWIREEWLMEENLKAANKVILFPSQYLKDMAPHFKKVEPIMEETFWSSRYTKQ
ncbi:MAG TPA: hypothetical protein VK921_01750 [Anditalea sp.]|nr:hypothetical protein [Anditalea sp.]